VRGRGITKDFEYSIQNTERTLMGKGREEGIASAVGVGIEQGQLLMLCTEGKNHHLKSNKRRVSPS